MPRVLVKCPVDGKVVPTGYRMNQAKLDVAEGNYAFRCSACGTIHQWVRTEAWVEASHRY